MDKEECAVLEQLSKLGCRSIELHGGEPTLRRDLPELVSCCTGLGMGTMFATNGLSMTEQLASELVEAGLKQIRFSLEGPRETHNLIRGRGDAFDKQMQAIEAIHEADKANRVTKIINTTISSLNIQGIEDVIHVARRYRSSTSWCFWRPWSDLMWRSRPMRSSGRTWPTVVPYWMENC